jgi:hypothetical protein
LKEPLFNIDGLAALSDSAVLRVAGNQPALAGKEFIAPKKRCRMPNLENTMAALAAREPDHHDRK